MGKKGQAKNKKLPITYEQASLFRKIPVHGAFGGFTKEFDFQMSIYSESVPAPEDSYIEIDEEARVVKEHSPHGQIKRLQREVEATLVMNIPTLLSLTEWLNGKIKELEQNGMLKVERRAEKK